MSSVSRQSLSSAGCRSQLGYGCGSCGSEGIARQMLPGDRRLAVHVSPSHFRVTPEQASDLALIINELAINTTKHAFPPGVLPHVVHIGVRMGCKGDRGLLELRDDGPGYPEEVLQFERYSTGLHLVKTLVERGLRGKVEPHNDGGAVATVWFPKEAV